MLYIHSRSRLPYRQYINFVGKVCDPVSCFRLIQGIYNLHARLSYISSNFCFFFFSWGILSGQFFQIHCKIGSLGGSVLSVSINKPGTLYMLFHLIVVIIKLFCSEQHSSKMIEKWKLLIQLQQLLVILRSDLDISMHLKEPFCILYLLLCCRCLNIFLLVHNFVYLN